MGGVDGGSSGASLPGTVHYITCKMLMMRMTQGERGGAPPSPPRPAPPQPRPRRKRRAGLVVVQSSSIFRPRRSARMASARARLSASRTRMPPTTLFFFVALATPARALFFFRTPLAAPLAAASSAAPPATPVAAALATAALTAALH